MMTQATAPVDLIHGFSKIPREELRRRGREGGGGDSTEYMQPSVARGFAGFAVSLSLYVAAIVGMAVLDRWYLVPPLVVGAGLGGWGRCIASVTTAVTARSHEIVA
jgi:hypothetical protein